MSNLKKKLWRHQAGVKIRQINFSEFYTWPNFETADGKNKNFGILKMTRKNEIFKKYFCIQKIVERCSDLRSVPNDLVQNDS